MVMGRDSCSEGCEFNPSTIYWMNFFTLNCCKFCSKKRPGMAYLKKLSYEILLILIY